MVRAGAQSAAERQADGGLLLGGAATAFTVTVDNAQPAGAPATVQLVAEVAYGDALLALVGLGPRQDLAVQAAAGTCGAKG